MSQQEPLEGVVFGLPLDPGYALGAVTRLSDWIGFGVFFGPRLARLPNSAPPLDRNGVIFSARFDASPVREGRWKNLGIAKDWDRDRWPIPRFSRFDELLSTYLVVEYGDNLMAPRSERPVVSGFEHPESFPVDEIFGEVALRHVVASKLP